MKTKLYILTVLTIALTKALLLSTIAQAQIAPPSLGESTKGTPAVPEVKNKTETNTEQAAPAGEDQEKPQSFTNSLLGEATITESRRESGQVYRIELEHSSGSKQYIEENDSDGKLTSDSVDLEDTPNLPKWKLGSW